jgi:hypothetical protein
MYFTFDGLTTKCVCSLHVYVFKVHGLSVSSPHHLNNYECGLRVQSVASLTTSGTFVFLGFPRDKTSEAQPLRADAYTADGIGEMLDGQFGICQQCCRQYVSLSSM